MLRRTTVSLNTAIAYLTTAKARKMDPWSETGTHRTRRPGREEVVPSFWSRPTEADTGMVNSLRSRKLGR